MEQTIEISENDYMSALPPFKLSECTPDVSYSILKISEKVTTEKTAPVEVTFCEPIKKNEVEILDPRYFKDFYALKPALKLSNFDEEKGCYSINFISVYKKVEKSSLNFDEVEFIKTPGKLIEIDGLILGNSSDFKDVNLKKKALFNKDVNFILAEDYQDAKLDLLNKDITKVLKKCINNYADKILEKEINENSGFLKRLCGKFKPKKDQEYLELTIRSEFFNVPFYVPISKRTKEMERNKNPENLCYFEQKNILIPSKYSNGAPTANTDGSAFYKYIGRV